MKLLVEWESPGETELLGEVLFCPQQIPHELTKNSGRESEY
jgi:hypothetical protein